MSGTLPARRVTGHHPASVFLAPISLRRRDLINWDMEPGDVLIFHPLVVHGSGGNSSLTTRRRALATRWFGDDVVYRDLPHTTPPPSGHGRSDGDPFTGDMFPS